MDKRVTIRNIADKAEVSISTVNAALTGKGRVSAAKREAILRIAKEMGYHTNRVAQSMARKPLRLGILLPEETSGYFATMREGIELELREIADFNVSHVIVSENFHHFDQARSDEVFAALKRAAVDAIVFCYGEQHVQCQALLNRLDQEKLPIITLNCELKLPGGRMLPLVTIDGPLSGALAAEFLSLSTPPGSKVLVASAYGSFQVVHGKIERFRGYLEQHTDLKVLPTLQLDSTDGDYGGSFENVLRLHPDVRGVYICTGCMGDVCRVIQAHGLERQIRVVATDYYSEEVKGYVERNVIQAVMMQKPVLQGRVAIHSIYTSLVSQKPLPQLQQMTPSICLRQALLKNGTEMEEFALLL